MFRIYHIIPEDVNELSKIIGESFCNGEPMSKHLGLKSNDFSKWSSNVIMNCIDNRMSFVAKNDDNKIYGCIISEPLNLISQIPEYNEAKPIFNILDSLYDKLPKYVINNKTLHLYLAATATESSGLGVCYKLCKFTIAKAKKYGYKYIIAELTSPITQKILLDKLGFQNINEIIYDNDVNFKGCPGKCVFALLDLASK